MMKEDFCDKCVLIHECEKMDGVKCQAFNALVRVAIEEDRSRKRELIIGYAKELNVIECEVSDELRKLGEALIKRIPGLGFITEFDIKVGYVLSYEPKKKDGKYVNAECRKVTGTYLAYLPFDFVLTFYEPNMSYMTENQQKILMLHELQHIGIGDRGLKIEPHDIDDFNNILTQYGLHWDEVNNDVPDILKLEK